MKYMNATGLFAPAQLLFVLAVCAPSGFSMQGGPCVVSYAGGPPAPSETEAGASGVVEPIGGEDGAGSGASSGFVAAPDAFETYGCGVNPTDSLTVLEGQPTTGSTLVFGLDDPYGSKTTGSLSFVLISTRPAGAYPCGDLLPNAGMDALFGYGELLISLEPGDLVPVIYVGDAWQTPGTPARVSVAIPLAPTLAGQTYYAQGVLWDAFAPRGERLGLTDAVVFTLDD